ncbi:MAG: hypothetical protein ACOCUH_03710 [Bacteriovoracia bacterium]
MKADELPTIILSDQPTDCINCGKRTEFTELDDGGQVHVCPVCDEVFFAVKDEDN